ncbi:DUF5677 domain-containing protein [Facilibium subflavum]|uniref:DUF5677 domain-containing protein n=1 Tax=Facilibium subflavum TaxID=2219058 RepID=UPI000E652B7F|nr:DUF5677 domain-containing protein [Facilibium subflavum]
MKIKGILDRCAFIVNRYNTYQMPPLVLQLAKDYLLLIQKGRSYAACIILRSLIESIANFKLELSCPEKYKAMIDNNEYALYKHQLISSNSELASLVDVKTLNNNLRQRNTELKQNCYSGAEKIPSSKKLDHITDNLCSEAYSDLCPFVHAIPCSELCYRNFFLHYMDAIWELLTILENQYQSQLEGLWTNSENKIGELLDLVSHFKS